MGRGHINTCIDIAKSVKIKPVQEEKIQNFIFLPSNSFFCCYDFAKNRISLKRLKWRSAYENNTKLKFLVYLIETSLFSYSFEKHFQHKTRNIFNKLF